MDSIPTATITSPLELIDGIDAAITCFHDTDGGINAQLALIIVAADLVRQSTKARDVERAMAWCADDAVTSTKAWLPALYWLATSLRDALDTPADLDFGGVS